MAEASRPARVRLIGGFRLSDGAGKPAAIPSRRGRALLAYLLLSEDHAATRERLAGLLWSDRGETQARASLRQCLLELRGALAAAGIDALDIGRDEIALRPGTLASDVDDARKVLEEGAVRQVETTLQAIGRARLLDGLELPGLFGEWLEQTRARFEANLTAAVARRLGRLEAEGDWAGVRALAQSWLEREPLDESAAAAAIRADVALGARSAAHRRFRLLEAALAREFGIAPSVSTRAALSAAPPPASSATTPVVAAPADTAALVEAAAPSAVPPLVVVAVFEPAEAGDAEVGLLRALRDEVLSGLARFHELRVITDPRPLDQVAADLAGGAGYVLGASARGAGADRRLLFQLLRGGERRVVWSGRFGAPGETTAWSVDDVVAKVVGAVLPTIDADRLAGPTRTADHPAWRRYLLARGPQAKDRTFATFEEARGAADALEAMIAADPAVDLPYLPLAYLYNTDFGYTRAWSSGPAELARALELAKTALTLDRGHAHGYTVAGWCHLRRRQWALARTHLDQALALNPFHVRRVMEVGYGLLFLGDLDAAAALFDRCLLLNPSPEDGFFMDLGLLSLVRGEHDRAASHLELMAESDIWGLVYRAVNAELGGLAAAGEAEQARRRITAIWPPDRTADGEGIVAWIDHQHPFQSPRMRETFIAGVRRVFSPAAPGPRSGARERRRTRSGAGTVAAREAPETNKAPRRDTRPRPAP
ncbi:MAG TPA: BTAD domain-containing putative transcriptional regulator [Caulobacteraceae bacterium]|nr:BTAD domain-containing putative transcriptional regulator [Caulobacteraceae bacterium]